MGIRKGLEGEEGKGGEGRGGRGGERRGWSDYEYLFSSEPHERIILEDAPVFLP